MPVVDRKKFLLLYVLNILREESDENHLLKQTDIIQILQDRYGIECDRKTIASYIQNLKDFDFDIISIPNKGSYLGQRELEPSEVTYLVDSLFASKIISSKQAQELSKKIYNLLSKHQRKNYKYIYKAEEVSRADNKQVFYNIDIIQEAIEKNKKLSFNYQKFYIDKEKADKHNNKLHIVNPYFLVNSQGKYYLVGNADKFSDIANYKLEHIVNIQIVDEERKPVTKLDNCANGLNIADYVNSNIYMFRHNPIDATLKLENDGAINNAFEWFGNNGKIYVKDGQTFIDIKVNKDALFYWCLQYGKNTELISPQSLRQELADASKQICEKYNK